MLSEDYEKEYPIENVISDMEDECFPAISISNASSRVESSSSSSSSSTSTVILKRNNVVPEDNECPEIKGEPISAPASPCAPCQPSCDMVDDKSTITIVSPQSLHFAKTQLSHMSDSEEDDEEYYQVYFWLNPYLTSRIHVIWKIKYTPALNLFYPFVIFSTFTQRFNFSNLFK